MLAAAACLLLLSTRAHAEEPLGHKPTAWTSKEFASHKAAAMRFGDAYRVFLGRHKTVREVAAAAMTMAQKKGYRDLFTARRSRLARGAKLYAGNHGKLVALVVVGERPIAEGVRLVAAHTDAVRIDLKPNPLYADGNAAWLETHYYGGIKFYQWLSQPLELRGVVVKKNGQVVPVRIGDDPDEPVLVIPDVAVHVASHVDGIEGEQVPAESLDALLSTTPAARPPAGKDPFAAEAERLLAANHDIRVDDLASAELELVPAVAPRHVGLDRALIGGYGQDDRACSYAALRAILDLGTPTHTAIVMLVDKEEVGSAGNTGAQSSFLRRVVAELIEGTGGTSTELAVDRALSASMVISADVIGAVNAQYRSLYDPKNNAFLGAGVVWNRSAVHAEVMGHIRALFDKAGIAHQPATWIKSQRSSSGSTVLPFFTRHGMRGLDVSIPLLSMHAPFELISKADLYEGYRAYRAFLAD
jgi:aspartyl aminopeptidase